MMGRFPSFEDFFGDWFFRRVIEDRLNSVEGRAEGSVKFHPRTDGGMDYLETSILTYGDHPPMTSERQYIWQDADDGIEVSFDDGRFFHRIDEGKPLSSADHKCEADMYHVTYDFREWPKWNSVWRVQGPKKDYRLTTEFERV